MGQTAPLFLKTGNILTHADEVLLPFQIYCLDTLLESQNEETKLA